MSTVSYISQTSTTSGGGSNSSSGNPGGTKYQKKLKNKPKSCRFCDSKSHPSKLCGVFPTPETRFQALTKKGTKFCTKCGMLYHKKTIVGSQGKYVELLAVQNQKITLPTFAQNIAKNWKPTNLLIIKLP